jgi:hypothetical protein
MKNKKLLLLGFMSVLAFTLPYIANMADLFGKFSAFGCLTGFSEIPVPESLREE